ncbi:hypothetical protein [Segetibacter aerophilus]|uniref:Transglycosylase n=1 Tax=Segetibacter aerophilus TaxID=670293 RepID=A0A512BHH9_9BACT|nr:hypothetical protein [Segetibacter aerophilus]GEO11439.1 hypothetical protein SAE01_39350 [Segetibacter aerophilus]
MLTLNIWNILGGISLILLVLFSKNKNAVWGGLAGGLIVGLIIAGLYSFKGNGFPWIILMKASIIGILAGSLFVLISRLSKK